MHEILSGFLSNDSRFGRLMTRLGIIIGANLMFVLFSLPVVTTGAAFAALYHVMLKTLRGSGVLNPFRAFWKGFRANFRQATIVWLLAMGFAALAWADIRFMLHAGGAAAFFRYGVYAVCVIAALLLLYYFPTLAAFDTTIPGLIRNSFFFLLKKPWKALSHLFRSANGAALCVPLVLLRFWRDRNDRRGFASAGISAISGPGRRGRRLHS